MPVIKLVIAALLLSALPIDMAMAKGTVKIITEPGKAQLFVDGKRKGTSPAKKGQTFAIKLAEGEYQIKAFKPHASNSIYDYVGTETVFVADDTLQTIEITLGKQVNEAAKAKADAAKAKVEAAKRVAKAKADAVKAKTVADFRKNPPSMVTVPAGSFRMGCVSGRGCSRGEEPGHQVNIKAFKLGATEVTFNQWDACVAADACNYSPADRRWGRGNRPIINVSWDDIQVYLKWINNVTGGNYRLPSEAEWEYAARAGSQTAYSWGNSVGNNRANCDGCGSQWGNSKTAPVKSFAPNAFGLYDMHGNVWELTQDCWNDSYKGAPSNGSAWLSGTCTERVLRGGSWRSIDRSLRAAHRTRLTTDDRTYYQGFRLAQDL